MDSGMTIILSSNDLEAVEIAALARAKGVEALDLGLPWGATPDPADPRLAPEALPPVVVLVELPDPGWEEALRRAGKRVLVIDHHRTADPMTGAVIDRRGDRPPRPALLAGAGGGAAGCGAADAPACDRMRLPPIPPPFWTLGSQMRCPAASRLWNPSPPA
jgi:hypothetical protein